MTDVSGHLETRCYRPIYLARIDDQRQRSFETGHPGPVGVQDHERSESVCVQDTISGGRRRPDATSAAAITKRD